MLGKSQTPPTPTPPTKKKKKMFFNTSKRLLKNRNWTFPVVHHFTSKLEFASILCEWLLIWASLQKISFNEILRNYNLLFFWTRLRVEGWILIIGKLNFDIDKFTIIHIVGFWCSRINLVLFIVIHKIY